MTRLILLCGALAAIAAGADIRLDLSGEWRSHAGDDPAWAAPEFDDSAWTLETLPRQGSPPGGYSWLRRRFAWPAESAGQSLVLTLGTLAVAYDVYCDGTQIASFKMDLDLAYVRPRSFVLPESLPRPGRPFVLAIRRWANSNPNGPPPTRRLEGVPDEGPYLLTSPEAAPRDPGRLNRLLRERLAVWGFATGAVRLVLIVILLGAWRTEMRRREFLALALVLATDAANRTGDSILIVMDYASALTGAALSQSAYLAGSLMGWFALEAFQVRNRWLRALVWVPPVLLGLSNFAMVRQLCSARDVIFCLYCLRVAGRAARQQGWRSSGTILALSTAAVLFFQTQRLGPLVRLNLTVISGGYLFHLYDLLVIALTTGMTLQLLLRLGEDRREKDRLSSELESARTVQQLLMTAPADTPQWETAAEYHPALQVGGDFYWTRVEDDGALTVAVGDVSGKGLRAAMLASLATGVLGHARGLTPAALLSELNRELAGRMGGGFVTCCCARFAPDGVTIANAGHVTPYVDGREVEVSGLPLGVVAGADYSEEIVVGDRFVFVSDGVIEAANSSGELFGFDRTRAISTESAQAIAEAAKQWGQNDDITVVTVRRSATAS